MTVRTSFPPLTIRGRTLLPVVQGGMGVGISAHRLAGSVAREGAVGTIASIDLRHHHADLLARCRAQPDRATLEAANLEALAREIRLAKTYSEGRGMIAVNVMKAVSAHADYVRVACDEGADAIVMGAGLPLDLPDLTQGHDIALIPILSDSRGIALVLKKWMKKGRLPDAIVIEHPAHAGGHLGVTQIDDMHDPRFDFARVLDETAQVMASLGIARETIPLIVAGGINSHDTVRAAFDAGANGVQVGTPFAVTEEGDAHPHFKRVLADATPEDIVEFVSVTGLPARGEDAVARSLPAQRDAHPHQARRAEAALPDRARMPERMRLARRHREVRPFLHRHTARGRAARRRGERAVLPRPRSVAVRLCDPQRARFARPAADGPCDRACGKPSHVYVGLTDIKIKKRPYRENGNHSLGVRTMHKTIRTCVAAAAVAAAFAAMPSLSHAASPGDGINQGDVLVRLRAISIQPNERASDTLGALNVGVNNAIVPELDFTYMIRDYLGVELILGTSRHQLTSSLGNLGGVGVLPPTLLLQYHFNHAGKVRPYVGAGLNYTYFYNNGLNVGGQGVSINKSSFGPALQFGVDVQVTKKIFMNVDVKKIWMSTDATLGDKGIGTLHIDPLIVGVGVGMKF